MSRLFLTGATGFLGGELAVALSKLDSIEKIFCLIRTKDDDDAVARLKQVFALHGDYFNRAIHRTPKRSPYSDQLEHIKATVGRKNARMLLAGLDAYWQSIDLNQRFNNSRMLADAHIGLPEPAHVYLKRTAPYLHAIDPLQAAVNP